MGYQQARAFGVAAIFNAGQTFAVGGGIQHVINCAIASAANNLQFSGIGGTSAQSAGDGMWTGVAQVRSTLAQSQVRAKGSGNRPRSGAPITRALDQFRGQRQGIL